MSSIGAQYQGVTNSARPQNNQAAIISGTIDYTAKDVGQWQSDGSVVLNLAGILNANPSFYPQSIIIVNPNGYSVPVSINPATINYRITVPAGSIVRDLCLCFTQGLSIQFGAIATPSAPLEYIITNFPLAPETIDMFIPSGIETDFFLSGLSPFTGLPSFIAYTNNTASIVKLKNVKLNLIEYGDYINQGSMGISIVGSTGTVAYFPVEWNTNMKSTVFVLDEEIIIVAGGQLIFQITDGTAPAIGGFRVSGQAIPLIYNL